MDRRATIRNAAAAGTLALCGLAVPAHATGQTATTLYAESVTGHANIVHEDGTFDYWLAGPVAARLTSGGLPLQGKLITFTVRGQTLCLDVTSASGYADCSIKQLVGFSADLVLGQGYQAAFAGDDIYAPSSATGPFTDLNVGP